jgi:hypothetical protein
MLHQTKGIGNGRQDVQHLLFKTWKGLQLCNDQVNFCVYLAKKTWQPLDISCPNLFY